MNLDTIVSTTNEYQHLLTSTTRWTFFGCSEEVQGPAGCFRQGVVRVPLPLRGVEGERRDVAGGRPCDGRVEARAVDDADVQADRGRAVAEQAHP